MRRGEELGATSLGGLLSERLFVYYIGHFGEIAAIVGFEHVDQSLNAAAGHAFVGIGGEAGDARGAGKVRHKAAAVGNGGIAQRRVGRQRFLFVDIEGGAGDPVFAEGFYQRKFIDDRAARVVDQDRRWASSAQGLFVE